MKQYYLQTKDEVLKEFKTGSDGLSTKQAEENLAKYGKNALVEGKKKTAFQVFLEQFKDLMVNRLYHRQGHLRDLRNTLLQQP